MTGSNDAHRPQEPTFVWSTGLPGAQSRALSPSTSAHTGNGPGFGPHIAEPPSSGSPAALCGATPDRSGFTISPAPLQRRPAPDPNTGCSVEARQAHPASS